MRKELIITIVIVCAIFIADFITQNYTKMCVKEINESLQDLKQSALNEEKDNMELANKANDIYENWLKKGEKLSCYLEHNELEKVHSSLRTIKAFCEADEISEGVPEIENCMYILYHIQEKEAFNLKNIF